MRPLAALLLATPYALCAPAWADDVFPRPLVEVVPPGAVQGGETIMVRVLALKADGTPNTGLSLKPSASRGKASDFSEVGEGWYRFRFEVPEVETPTEVALGVASASTRVVVLPAAPTGTIAVTSSPEAIVLGRAASATLKFQVDDHGEDEIVFSTSAGELTDLTAMGDGLFSLRFEPPSVNYPHLAVVTVASRKHPGLVGSGVIALRGAVDFPVRGDAGTSVLLNIEGTDFGPVKLDDQGAGKVPIVVSPGVSTAQRTDIVAGKRSNAAFDLKLPATRRLQWVPASAQPVGPIKVRVAVRQPGGSPAIDEKPVLSASAGQITGAKHVGGGVYEATFTPTAAGTATLTASLGDAKVDKTTLEVPVLPAFPDAPGTMPPPSTGSAVSVVVVPKKRDAAPGAAVEVLVAAVDANGFPVPGTTLTLGGDNGSVAKQVTTDDTGIATVSFTPAAAGMATLTARVGTLASSSTVLSAEPVTNLVWPTSTGHQGRWEKLIPRPRGVAPKPDPVTEPAPAPKPSATAKIDAAATVTEISVAIPEAVRPGDKVEVVATAVSENGSRVPGQSLDFLANDGGFGSVEDRGDGTYAAVLKVPKSRGETLKITVLNSAGVLGRATARIDANAATAPAEIIPTREHVIPRLRIRAGFAGGSYQYAQRPNPEGSGPLIPGSLIVGGSEGGSAAPLMGVDVNARAWFIDYVGVDAGFRAMAYGISSDAFSEDARDWLVHGRVHLTGRYPFDIGSDQFWIGLQAGFEIDDFLVFKGCLEPGCEVAYDPLVLPALEVGASIGAEFGPVFFVGSFNQGLLKGTSPHRIGVDADVGLEVHRNVFIDLGFAFASRVVLVRGSSGTEFGQLSDTAILGRGSLGVQF